VGQERKFSPADILMRAPLFAALPRQDLEALIADCRVHSAPSGTRLFSPLDPADRFYVVLTGRVKVFQLSAGGDEQILHLCGPGQTFGEAAVWSGARFPAHAVALTGARLLVVRREALVAAIRRRPEIAFGMLGGLSSKLREFAQLIERLSLKDVPARLAAALLEISARSGADTFTLDRTKRELAGQMGTVPETLSRALARLKAHGLIAERGGRVRVLDREGLRRLAES